jgi:hypothetical protein
MASALATGFMPSLAPHVQHQAQMPTSYVSMWRPCRACMQALPVRFEAI